MKLKLFGALLGAIMLMAAAPAFATTLTGTSDVNVGGSSYGAVTLNGSGVNGINGGDYTSNGKKYFDYIFSFAVTGPSNVTFSTSATGGTHIFDYQAALFSTTPAGTNLQDGTNPLISLDVGNTAMKVVTAVGNLTTLSASNLATGTYYLRLFGVITGNSPANSKLTGLSGTFTSVAATPIPAALPLFATALGMMGFFGWRRKSTAAVAAV